ncbi:MAG TPA: type II toxin-antitoxin system VapC family toxin [Acidimicrobiales bacterium]
MIAVDSSVVIAGFASWSEHHRQARRILDDGARLVAHAAMEAYSVLTRLPPPHRAPPDVVHEFLVTQFREPWLTLSERRQRKLLAMCARSAVAGGATYDALIASTAGAHDAVLASCDKRAVPTYEAMGTTVRLIA